MFQKLKLASGLISKYLLISFGAITSIILMLFWVGTPAGTGGLDFIYSLSIFSYYFFITLVICLFFSPLYFSKYLKYLIIVPKILLDIFLLADYFVFKIYRFHIDMLFIKMAISDFNGIGLSPLFSGISLLAIILISSLNLYIFLKIPHIKLPFIKPALVGLLLLFLSGQIIHIWANYYKQHFIEQYTPYFPYYFPTTSHNLMKKLKKEVPNLIPEPLEKPSENLTLKTVNKDALIHYPLQKLIFDNSIQKPNILLIVLESWRADKLNPEVMPHLDSLARHSIRYNKHYSTGNVTVSGIFGLMYGLHPSYLSYVQADAYNNQSILTKSLQQLGYEIKAYTSSNLNRFSLKAMLFNRINKNHYYEVLGKRADIADREIIDKIKSDLEIENSKPWFKFLFLTSSHHHYNYPSGFKKFKPVPTNSEGFIFDNNINPAPFINDYQNALLYEDALVNDIIKHLILTGKLKNTVLIITGDHAEEFNDNAKAYWGHGSNFTLYQTHVPLIIYKQNDSLSHQYNFFTGHIDIVPTILKDYLGCQNPVSDFSSGINFKALQDQSRSFIQTSYKDKAYLIDSIVYSTGLMVKSYRIDDIKQSNKVYDIKRINTLRKEESRFLK